MLLEDDKTKQDERKNQSETCTKLHNKLFHGTPLRRSKTCQRGRRKQKQSMSPSRCCDRSSRSGQMCSPTDPAASGDGASTAGPPIEMRELQHPRPITTHRERQF